MKLSDTIERKFVEQKNINKWEVLTEDGYKPIELSNKTIEYEVYEIILEDNISIKCADTHILIDEYYNEVFAKDSLNINIRTKHGIKKVISVKNLGFSENMYDLSINSKEHTYYTNDILSHNTVSTSTYLLWLFTFRENPTTIGIVANKASGSKEVLDKIKKIFLELPIWLMPNIEVWNKTQIESESENRILTDVPSSDSFRGFTCVDGNTKIELKGSDGKTIKMTIKEAYELFRRNKKIS